MDRAEYRKEIENDANSIVTDGSFEPCDLNRSTFNLAHSESDAISRIAGNTISYGNMAAWVLVFSQNTDACEELGEIPNEAHRAVSFIAEFAYRADLSTAVSEYSDDEIAEIRGWHQCPECDDWHETESDAAKCCGAECAWCGEDTDGSEHCSEECAREAAADEEDDDADADDATDDERGLACWEDGEI